MLLSFVVPIYDVEEHLAQCLESILAVREVDIELIGVDDASRDASGAILDEFAAQDERVRAIHLGSNGGVGGARNVGLAEARGDYVWFIDSDDWIDPSAVLEVAARLRAVAPDLLIVDHQRELEGAAPEPSGDGDLIRSLASSLIVADRSGLAEWLSPFPWNRVFRRRFLTASDLPFPAGIYEDVPVVLPALAAAETVTVLDRIAVHYRQRPGSFTSEVSSKHTDVIHQYDLALTRLRDLGPPGADLHLPVYRRMLRHLFQRMGSGKVPKGMLDAYFRQAAEMTRKWEPPGFRPRGRLEAARHRLLRVGSRRLATALQRAHQLSSGRVPGSSSEAAPARRTSSTWIRKAVLILYYRMQRLLPIDDDLALYTAYWGSQVGVCNPRAIQERAAELAPRIRGVWVVGPHDLVVGTQEADTVLHGTAAYFRVLARARYLITNESFSDHFAPRPGTVVLQTHHGTPLKKMGADLGPAEAHKIEAIVRRARTWTHHLSSSPYTSEVWPAAYSVAIPLLEVGQPRNDVLVSADDATIAGIRRQLGIADDDVAILYAPTFRSEGDGSELVDPHALVDRLGPGHRILARKHRLHVGADLDGANPAVIDARSARIEDLFLAADVLITDYSSVMFDFAVLDRPIVIFATDWEHYQRTRGTYFDLSADPPGPFVTDFEALVDLLLSKGHQDPEMAARRQQFRARFCPWDDGRASERVVRHLFLGEPLDRPGR